MMIRRSVLLAVVSCSAPEPSFGDPHGIQGKLLPNEGQGTSGSSGSGNSVFPAAYDPASGRPTTSLAAGHSAKGGPAPADNLACLTCHMTGGAAAAKVWSFGGRITKSGAPVANADILVVSGGANLGPVKSDADGFFWFSGSPLIGGARSYVRLGTSEAAMGAPLAATQGSCDSADCHIPGKQGKISVP